MNITQLGLFGFLIISGRSFAQASDDTTKELKPTQIGDGNLVSISLKDLTDSPNGDFRTYKIQHDKASYLSVHFSALDLPQGCSVTLADKIDEQKYTLTGKGLFGLGSFWGHHVTGDTMVVTLQCKESGDMKDATISIDEYISGYPTAPPERDHRNLVDSICGKDDRRNAICYKSTFADRYKKARAVARLLIKGRFACTGWLVGRDILITNYHCIDSLYDVQNTDFEFMAEESGCSTSQDGSWFTHRSTQIFDGVALLASSKKNDYALIRLESNVGDTFGYLTLDNRYAKIGEEIYIPQHPSGRPKEIGIFDTNASNGRCNIKSKRDRGCTGGAHSVMYSCDTQGGSSGSPVIAVSSNKVIALHNCGARGACAGNKGVPVPDFYSEISKFLPQTVSSCKDTAKSCASWKRQGHCSVSKVKNAYCRKTCNNCLQKESA